MRISFRMGFRQVPVEVHGIFVGLVCPGILVHLIRQEYPYVRIGRSQVGTKHLRPFGAQGLIVLQCILIMGSSLIVLLHLYEGYRQIVQAGGYQGPVFFGLRLHGVQIELQGFLVIRTCVVGIEFIPVNSPQLIVSQGQHFITQGLVIPLFDFYGRFVVLL